MSNPVLTDVQAASFTPDGGSAIDFNAQIVSWTDSRKPRLAVHEYLKRDGAEVEYMGRAPFHVRFDLVYVGKDWRRQFKAFVAAVEASPTGVLSHPFFGDNVKVACEGFDGSRVTLEELDTVLVPVSFVENNVDQRLEAEQTQGVSARSSGVSTYAANVTSAVALFASATTAAGQLTAAAIGYAAAAAASFAPNAPPDATLSQQLSAVVTAGSATVAAVRSDKAATSDVAAFPAILAVEQLLDACAQVDNATRTSRPTLSLYVVPAQTSLLAIAQKFYGRDASKRLDEIRNNNVGKIQNPAAIPTGTALYLATPTQPVRVA